MKLNPYVNKMSKKHFQKTVDLYMNPYYDTVLSTLNIIVPSNQYSHKKDDRGQLILNPPTKGVREFEYWMKEEYLKKINAFGWPLKGDLFVLLDIRLTKKEYSIKDVDNIARSLIDSMKGIVFDDDVQICSLIIVKSIDDVPGFVIAIKCIKDADDRRNVMKIHGPISDKPYQ